MNVPSIAMIPAIERDDQETLNSHILLRVIVLLAIVLRFFYLIELQFNPLPLYVSQMKGFDQEIYVSLAHDLLAHGWLGSKITSQSPAYAYLIAVLFRLFGPTLNSIFIFQMAFGILSIYTFYKAARLLFENTNIGLLAAFIAAVYSPFIYYEGVTLREIMIAYFNLLSFYLLLTAIKKGRIRYFGGGGLAVGLSAILRSNVLVAVLTPYILTVVRKSFKVKILAVLLFLLGVALAVAPLAIRNKMVGYKAIIETSEPFVFWSSNVFYATGVGGRSTPYQDQLTQETQGKIGKIVKTFIREIRKYPVAYRELFARKFKLLFNAYEVPANLSYDLFRENSKILKIAFCNFAVISPVGISGFFLVLLRRLPCRGLFLTYFLTLTAFVFLFHIQSRMRILVVPFFIILAAYSLYWMVDMLKRKKICAFFCALLFLVAAGFFTKSDEHIIKRIFISRIRPMDYMNMANAYLHQYRLQEGTLSLSQKQAIIAKAQEYYRKGLEVTPLKEKEKWQLPPFLKDRHL